MDKIKGKIKETAGALSGNKKLELEGKAQQIKGDVKGAAASGKRAIKDAAKR